MQQTICATLYQYFTDCRTNYVINRTMYVTKRRKERSIWQERPKTKKLQDEIFRTCRAVAFVRFMQAQGKTPFCAPGVAVPGRVCGFSPPMIDKRYKKCKIELTSFESKKEAFPMSKLESRRTFLKKTGLSLSGLAFLSLAGCAQPASSSSSSAVAASSEPAAEAVAADAEIEIPSHPYPSCEFDLDRVEQLAYESFYQNGCCYAVTNALLTELKEKVGFPYTAIPAEMFVNGKTGYGASSLCGSLGGAAAVIGLMCSPDDSSAITKELFNWYTSTNLPIYQPEIQAETPTVAKTVNCADSVTTFMAAAGITEM